jgi:FkbM family methyltransferase
MFIKMKRTIGTPGQPYLFRHLYDVQHEMGHEWIEKGIAEPTDTPPPHIQQVLDRLDVGAGEKCLFLPFIGEFGHEIMSHIRMVHFHKASEKIVCCRPGNEVLYPSADGFFTDWTNPIPDSLIAGTGRSNPPDWADIIAQFPGYRPIGAGNLTTTQELFEVCPGQRIPFAPPRTGLQADVLFGVRNRKFCPEKNWPHWKEVAAAVEAAGYTWAVIGDPMTSHAMEGHEPKSGQDAVELMQNCRLYVGSDTGSAHLAAAVGCEMIVFREEASGNRDLRPRMVQANPGKVEILNGVWDKPQTIIEAVLDRRAGRVTIQTPPSDHYAAQHGEDKWIARHWGWLGLPEHGTFVEVGAADGLQWSNTAWLAREKGWTGLLIEADERTATKISRNRPESNVEIAAAGREAGTAQFMLTGEPTLSGMLRKDGTPVTVPVETLTTLLDRNGINHVDVLSIDVEGMELDVWAGLDLDRWKPSLVIIEWNTLGLTPDLDKIRRRLTADGYQEAAMLGGNLLFRPKETT